MSEKSARIAVMVGAGLIALGAFLPWVSVGLLSVTGLQGDGVIAILVGVAILAVTAAAYSDGPSAIQRAIVTILGIAGLLLYGWEFRSVAELAADRVGSGIILGAVGGLVVVLFSGGIGKRVARPS